jgi:predicted nucleic acid-binding protein
MGIYNLNKNIPAIDALIAASALVRNYKLITKNTKDFKEILGLEFINPWGDNSPY